MGDKSPKANQKHKSQQKAKANTAAQKKEGQAAAAKAAPKKKEATRTAFQPREAQPFTRQLSKPRYFAAFFFFATARRSVFLRRAARFFTFVLPWLCPIVSQQSLFRRKFQIVSAGSSQMRMERGRSFTRVTGCGQVGTCSQGLSKLCHPCFCR
jgi:hypothetical protein